MTNRTHQTSVNDYAKKGIALSADLLSLDIDEVNPGLSREAVKIAAAHYQDLADGLYATAKTMRKTMHVDMGVDPNYLTTCAPGYDTIIGFQARRGAAW